MSFQSRLGPSASQVGAEKLLDVLKTALQTALGTTSTAPLPATTSGAPAEPEPAEPTAAVRAVEPEPAEPTTAVSNVEPEPPVEPTQVAALETCPPTQVQPPSPEPFSPSSTVPGMPGSPAPEEKNLTNRFELDRCSRAPATMQQEEQQRVLGKEEVQKMTESLLASTHCSIFQLCFYVELGCLLSAISTF